jgi:folate-binding protein YgfZ
VEELIVDQGHWGQITAGGADRVRFMQAMCTADVTKIGVGEFKRAAILTAKARVSSIVDIVNRGDDLLLICEPDLADKTLALLGKHAIMDDVEFSLNTGPLHRIWTDPTAVWAAPPIMAPPPSSPASPEAVEIRRIEAGLIAYGTDVSEDHFPFESPLVSCIDYDKGCYLGQEPVFRVHSRGTAQRLLRGLRIEGDRPAEVGSTVEHPSRKRAGQVTSATISPDFGSIALAYIHRTVWNPGDRVSVGGAAAEIIELPFR